MKYKRVIVIALAVIVAGGALLHFLSAGEDLFNPSRQIDCKAFMVNNHR